MYGQEGWLGRARALEMPSYLAVLLSEDDVRVEVLLALPPYLKAVRCNHDRFLSRAQESLFSVTLIKDLTFCQP